MILIIISAVYFMITYKIDSVVSKSLCKNKAAFPLVVYYFFFFLCYFRATPVSYGGSQARGQIRATAPGHSHSHSNLGSELCL